MSKQSQKLKIGNNLRRLRMSRDLTQDEVAKAIEVTRATVLAIEKGDYNPSLELAFRLANFLGADINEIFYEDSMDIAP
jgi:putative transcriptional regulator